MASRQRDQAPASEQSAGGSEEESKVVERKARLNRRRRRKYSRDATYREVVKKSQREYYRNHRALEPSKLINGLLAEGVQREVHGRKIDPFVTEAFTMSEAGTALGKTLLTMRTWLGNGILPPCVLKDTSFGYNQLSKEELEIIAVVVADHEREYAYLRRNHTATIERLHSALAEYRAVNFT